MRTNTIPSSISSIYVSVVLLIALISVNEKAHGMLIKRETLKNTDRRSIDKSNGKQFVSICTTLGQACFGGHGKRSYSKIERDSLEESINRNLIESNKIQRGLFEKNIDQNLVESKIPTSDELFSILPNEEFRERLDQRYIRIRKDIQRFNSFPLSSLVNQLIAIHNRPHRIDSDFTNK